VEQLRKKNAVPQPVYVSHQLYHYSLFHKLVCAKHHVHALESLLAEQLSSAGSVDTSTLLPKANMYIDIFLYFGGSALDILAREVLSYFAIPLPRVVYYESARKELSKIDPHDPLLDRLGDPSWKGQFSDYRNAATHERLLADRVNVTVVHVGQLQETRVVLPLPDDPRIPQAQRKYEKNPDVVAYCIRQLRRIVSHTNQIYRELGNRIESTKKLPL
jgi:hypothetical protein